MRRRQNASPDDLCLSDDLGKLVPILQELRVLYGDKAWIESDCDGDLTIHWESEETDAERTIRENAEARILKDQERRAAEIEIYERRTLQMMKEKYEGGLS